jgi:hypothetical protein
MAVDLTVDLVRSLLDYDPETGEFRWKYRSEGPPEWNSVYPGKIAGALNTLGYRQIMVAGKLRYAHRLAWLLIAGSWPMHEIDHIDMVRSNNRFMNLREATRSKNTMNRGARAETASGLKGACWDKSRNAWIATIRVDGKQHFLGRFATAEEAHAAYAAAAATLHGDFARTTS